MTGNISCRDRVVLPRSDRLVRRTGGSVFLRRQNIVDEEAAVSSVAGLLQTAAVRHLDDAAFPKKMNIPSGGSKHFFQVMRHEENGDVEARICRTMS